MRLRFHKTGGNFRQEKLPILLFFFGLLLLYLVHTLSHNNVQLCLFHRVFGFECPSCGITRAFLSASRGNFLTAVSYNPLMFILTLIVLIYMALQLVFNISIKLVCSRREQNTIFVIFLLLLMLNWLYVILA
jgi:hypothetical protein